MAYTPLAVWELAKPKKHSGHAKVFVTCLGIIFVSEHLNTSSAVSALVEQIVSVYVRLDQV